MKSFIDQLPLRVRLVASATLLVVVGLGISGVAAATTLRGYLVQRVDDQLRQAASRPLDQLGFAQGPGGLGQGRDRAGPSEFFVAQVDQSGNVVRQFSQMLDTAVPQLSEVTETKAAGAASRPFTVPAASGGGQWRVIALPFPDGSGSLVIATSLSEVNHTVGRLELLDLLIGLVVVIVLAGVGYFVVRRSLRPLTEVEHTAAAIAAGDLTQRVPDMPAGTEVGRLSAALNGMLQQIERAFRVQQASEESARKSEQRMRQFVADASHELRTPLTSIRGFSELFRQGAVGSEEELQRVMRRIEDEAARMGVLVDDLLLLARLDQQRPLDRKSVDIAALAADAVADARAVAPDRPVTLDVSTDGGAAVVIGDEHRLRQVLGNLVGNALAHTPAGTPVAVRVRDRHDDRSWVVLEVADEGPGLAPDEAERVFERFYRADPSRTRAQGGSGLGLSIVASLAEAHGGSVELDTEPGNGATFRVVLPAAEVEAVSR